MDEAQSLAASAWTRLPPDPRGDHFYTAAVSTKLSDGRTVRVLVSYSVFADEFTLEDPACSPVYIETLVPTTTTHASIEGKTKPVAYEPLALKGPMASYLIADLRPSQAAVFAQDDLLFLSATSETAPPAAILFVVNLITGFVEIARAANVPPMLFAMSCATAPDFLAPVNPETKRFPPRAIVFGGAVRLRGDARTIKSTWSFPLRPLPAGGKPSIAIASVIPDNIAEIAETRAVPAARLYHAACTVRGTQMYVFGGAPDAKDTTLDDPVFNDLWALDLVSGLWREIERPAEAPSSGISAKAAVATNEGAPRLRVWPSPRGSVQLIFVDPFIYMIGGFDGAKAVEDAWRFDVDAELWEPVATPNPEEVPIGWCAYSAWYDGRTSSVHLLGGGSMDANTGSILPAAHHAAVTVPRPTLYGAVSKFIGERWPYFAADMRRLKDAGVLSSSARLRSWSAQVERAGAGRDGAAAPPS